jgi:electron transfer flavoprotein alpha subunit
VANLLVIVEVDEGRARPVSLEALGQARRIGSALGATVYAVVPIKRAPGFGGDDLIAVLGCHGADKVVLVTDEALPAGSDAMRWGTHGPALGVVSELLPPLMLVFGATVGGREVAPRAAARMGAAFVPEAWLELVDDRLVFFRGSGDQATTLADEEYDFPIVVTIPPGRYTPAAGDDEAEVEIVATSGRLPDFEEVGEEQADSDARVLADDRPELMEPAESLARALGVTGPSRGDARLAISLGPPLEGIKAEVRVALGDEAARSPAAHYAVAGSAPELARALAEALGARR